MNSVKSWELANAINMSDGNKMSKELEELVKKEIKNKINTQEIIQLLKEKYGVKDE